MRTLEDLERVEALVLPGGESTTIGFMLAEHDMLEPLRKRISGGMPVLGTCAGAILLAKEVVGGAGQDRWPTIGVLDATVHRNAYGSRSTASKTTSRSTAWGRCTRCSSVPP